MKLKGNLYLSNRFFLVFSGIILCFVVSFYRDVLFPVAQTLLVAGLAITLADALLLYRKGAGFQVKRTVPRMLSLGNENHIRLEIQNGYPIPLNLYVTDEVPIQFQKRDFELQLRLKPGEKRILDYTLRPLTRGEYVFRDVNLIAHSILGLAERRVVIPQEQLVPVYPSIIEMKNFELKAMSRISNFHGIKKLRRLGQSYEFEQIRNYVKGDDYRGINWKATSRKNQLMINQFEDEKAQQVYSILDASRSMHMPFNGLSLLDYSVNAALVISNIALGKQDKTGLFTFSEKIDTVIKADKGKGHLRKILEGLYKQQEHNLEANYELLYLGIRNAARGRSLLFLYTNFESYSAMERVLPIIRRLNKIHLLVVVFFENTEILDYSNSDSQNVEEIYLHSIAQKYVSEKQQIVNELRQYGIQAILTRPEDLTINSVNKYLELKSRGMI